MELKGQTGAQAGGRRHQVQTWSPTERRWTGEHGCLRQSHADACRVQTPAHGTGQGQGAKGAAVAGSLEPMDQPASATPLHPSARLGPGPPTAAFLTDTQKISHTEYRFSSVRCVQLSPHT